MWDKIRDIVLACIAGFGGGVSIIVISVKAASKFVAEQLSKNYEHKLELALEKYKTELTKKEYVSKARFDVEFRMYQELSEKNITMVYCAGEAVLFTRGFSDSDEDINCFIDKYCVALNNAEKTNKQYAPFISKIIFEKYLQLENHAAEIFKLLKAWNQYRSGQEFTYRIHNTVYHNQGEVVKAIAEKQKILSNESDTLLDELRDYLSKLDIID